LVLGFDRLQLVVEMMILILAAFVELLLDADVRLFVGQLDSIDFGLRQVCDVVVRVGFVRRLVALVALRLLVALLVLCREFFSEVVESLILTQMMM
jgi:hypothetical protein